jgi:DNA-binding XRE family transcriptional regulator
MKNRIISFLNAEKLTPARFADIIGVQPATISHIISERNKPSLEFIQKMLTSFPNINPEWLIIGKGNMYAGQNIQSTFEKNELFANQDTMQSTNNEQETNRNSINNILSTENNLPKTILEQNANNKDINYANKEIERIIICYSDKTFEFYLPR